MKGQKTDTLGITVYVKKTLQLQQLSAEEAIPPTISGIPTDVVECVNLWGPGKRNAGRQMSKPCNPVEKGLLCKGQGVYTQVNEKSEYRDGIKRRETRPGWMVACCHGDDL